MGGIDTDVNGATVMPGLYAAGECACVSVHGANRLGGNSLLETIVFGRRAGAEVVRYLEGLTDKRPNARTAFAAAQMMEQKVDDLGAKTGTEDAYALRTEMTAVMKEHFGVFRDEATMKAGVEKLLSVKERVGNIGLRWTGSVFNLDMIRTMELEGMIDLALCVGVGALAADGIARRALPHRLQHARRRELAQAHPGLLPAGRRRSASGFQAGDPRHLRATGAEVLMPDIKFRIKRQDPRSKKNPEAYWEEHTVTYEGDNLTVLEGLFYIQEKFDGSLSFRYCCRASICGSCAMYINGAYRLACQTNVKHLVDERDHGLAHAAPPVGEGPGRATWTPSSPSTSTSSPG